MEQYRITGIFFIEWVKQGAVISPPLFALYIDPLIENLTNSKKGCHIGNLCANAFAYADDVILLSPTCTALKSMIEICEQFSDDYKLQFNPDKCTLLIGQMLSRHLTPEVIMSDITDASHGLPAVLIGVGTVSDLYCCRYGGCPMTSQQC